MFKYTLEDVILGEKYLDRKEYESAYKVFNRIVSIDKELNQKSSPYVLKSLAICYMAFEDFVQAYLILDQAHQLDLMNLNIYQLKRATIKVIEEKILEKIVRGNSQKNDILNLYHFLWGQATISQDTHRYVINYLLRHEEFEMIKQVLYDYVEKYPLDHNILFILNKLKMRKELIVEAVNDLGENTKRIRIM